MTEPGSTRPAVPPARDDGWGHDGAREALRLIAEDVQRRTSFRTCEIEVLRPDDMLEFVAIAGNEDADTEMLRRATPFSAMELTLGLGAEYGAWTFVAQEWLTPEAEEQLRAYCWIPDIPDTGDPFHWRPLDVLVAQVVDDQGHLRALVYLDEPESGLRPSAAELRELDGGLGLAMRAVLTAIEREELSQQVRLTRTARAVVRTASSRLDYRELLLDTREHLTDGFRADDLAVVVYAEPPPDPDPGSVLHLPSGLAGEVVAAARRAWDQQVVVIVEPDRVWGDDTLDEHRAALSCHLAEHDTGALVLAPIGAGREPLGVLMLARRLGRPRWTGSETAAVLDVGHDLGRAILNSRTHDRERELISELTRLDAHRSRLISTISHELKNPLGVITGHLEMLDAMPGLSSSVRRSLDSLERSSTRLLSVADDLLLLSRMERAERPPEQTPVALGGILREVVEDSEVLARRERVRVEVGDNTPTAVCGDAEELRRMTANLVDNAIKYSRPGGRVLLSLRDGGEQVVLECADDGLGISAEDQEHLFTEFFRSTNPEAYARPGTGLGLAIVRRIVARHEGEIAVVSRMGEGTTFTVTLPAAG